MDSKQQRVTIVVERLEELQVDLDLLHQEQATLVNRCPRTNPICPNGT